MTSTRPFGWVAYLDIFAFRHLLIDQGEAAISKNLAAYHTDLKANLKANRFNNFFLFSDSAVLWAFGGKSELRPLQKILGSVASMQVIASQHGYLLRGAVCYGSLTVGSNFLLGEAYLRAYHVESSVLVYPLTVIPAEEFSRSQISPAAAFELEDVDTKNSNKEKFHVLRFAPSEAVQRIAQANLATTLGNVEVAERHRLAQRWEWILEQGLVEKEPDKSGIAHNEG